MNPLWSLGRISPAAGYPGPLLVLDHEDGPDGRTVCVIPGHLEWRITARGVVHLLDETDVGNARLIAAAPQLRSVLAGLAEWSARTGGWDAPCWHDAHALLARLRDPHAEV